MIVYSNSENNIIFGENNKNTPFKYVKLNEILQQYHMFSVGYSHAVVITKEGYAMAIGNDKNFTIGTEKRVIYKTFARVTFKNHNIFQAAFCGSDYTLYLTSDSTLIYCHIKRIKNMYAEHHLEAPPVLLSGSFNRPIVLDANGDIHIFSSVDLYSKPKFIHLQQKIISVCGGIFFTVVVTETGEIKASGSLGDKSDNFIDINILKGTNFVQVAGNHSHCLLLAQNGDVYSAGWNLFGQLGRGNEQDSFDFNKINSLNGIKIVSIAAGYLHSIFLTDDKCIYACGSNFYNQLFFQNKNQKVLVPKLVEKYQHMVDSVYIGQFSTYIKLDEKKVSPNSLKVETELQQKENKANIAKQKATDENMFQTNKALNQHLNDSLDREKILLDKVTHLQKLLAQKENHIPPISDKQELENCKLISEMTYEIENLSKEKKKYCDQIFKMKKKIKLLKEKCSNLKSTVDNSSKNSIMSLNESSLTQNLLIEHQFVDQEEIGVQTLDEIGFENDKSIAELMNDVDKLHKERDVLNAQIVDMRKEIEMLQQKSSISAVQQNIPESICNGSCPINLVLTHEDLKAYHQKPNDDILKQKIYFSSTKSAFFENDGKGFVEHVYTDIDTKILFSIYHMNSPFFDKITGFARICKDKKGKIYVIRKYYDRTLADVIGQGILSIQDKRAISFGIACAFKKMTEYSIGYQSINLKVENIMITKNNIPVFVDYVKNNSTCFNMTIASTNYIYLAPEIIREESSDNEMTVVYSFGVVLFFIFFGHLPQIKLLNIMNNQEIEIPDNHNDHLSAKESMLMQKMIQLIRHCLSPNVKNRFTFKQIFFYLATLNENMTLGSLNEVLDMISYLTLHTLQ